MEFDPGPNPHERGTSAAGPNASDHGRAPAWFTPDIERSADGVEAIGHALQAGSVVGHARVEATAVIDDSELQLAVFVGRDPPSPSLPRRTWRRCSKLRACRSRRRPRSAAGIGRCGSTRRRPASRLCALAPLARRRDPCRPATVDRSRERDPASVSSASLNPSCRSLSIASSFSGSLPTSMDASRALTARATSSCCAPSCRLRSSLRRSSSWAATRRSRDERRSSRRARSSAVSRTFRSTRPAWDARSASSFSSANVTGSFAGLVSVRAPRSSPWCRTSATRSAPATSMTSRSSSGSHTSSAAIAGDDAARRRRSPTRSHTSALVAPVPSAIARASRGSTSSVANVSPIRSAKTERTSYGVARLPYTRRFAKRCARVRSGWNAIATIGCCHDREHHVRLSVGADRRSDPDDDRKVDDRYERGERAHDDRLVDHDVDVVEPVLQDRDRRRERDERERHDLQQLPTDVEQRAAEDDGGDEDRGREREPLDLLALVPGRAPHPHHQRGGREQPEHEHHQDAGDLEVVRELERVRGSCRGRLADVQENRPSDRPCRDGDGQHQEDEIRERRAKPRLASGGTADSRRGIGATGT